MTAREYLNRKPRICIRLIVFGAVGWLPLIILALLLPDGVGVVCVVAPLLALFCGPMVLAYPFQKCPFCSQRVLLGVKPKLFGDASTLFQVSEDIKGLPCCGRDIDSDLGAHVEAREETGSSAINYEPRRVLRLPSAIGIGLGIVALSCTALGVTRDAGVLAVFLFSLAVVSGLLLDAQAIKSLTVTLTSGHVWGQSGSLRDFYRRICIAREDIDVQRSSQQSFYDWSARSVTIWSKGGQCIVLNCRRLGRDQVREILAALGIERVDS